MLFRSIAMLHKNWAPGRKGKLPWSVETNRPALRLPASFIESFEGDWRDERTIDIVRFCLRLNPNDNHGYRRELVDHMLIQGRDAEALAGAERYSDDLFAETRYGEVLALCRLGHLDKAEARLGEAAEDLPLVPKYLLRDRVARPKMDGPPCGSAGKTRHGSTGRTCARCGSGPRG